MDVPVYSYDDAYTDKKASDYLAIETSGRYTSGPSPEFYIDFLMI
jgi:hypothetical protein